MRASWCSGLRFAGCLLTLVSSISGCGSNQGPTRQQPALVEPPAVAPPHRATWHALPTPPNVLDAHARVRLGPQRVSIDAGYTRYLEQEGSEALVSAREDRMLTHIALSSEGLVALDAEGELLLARDVVGKWEELLTLSKPSDVESLVVHQGAINIMTPTGVVVVPIPERGKSTSAHQLPTFDGRLPYQARVGRDGKGVVLFLPQLVTRTSQFGRQHQPVDEGDLFIQELIDDDAHIVLAPGGTSDVFARRLDPETGKLARSAVPEANRRSYQQVEMALQAIKMHREGDYEWRQIAPSVRWGRQVRAMAANYAHDEDVILDRDRFLIEHDAYYAYGSIGESTRWRNKRDVFANTCGDDLGLLGFSMCDGVAVAYCRGDLLLLKEGAAPELVPWWIYGPITSVSLTSKRDLFVTRYEKTGRSIWYMDLEDQVAWPVEVGRLDSLMEWNEGSTIGHCGMGREADLWSVNDGELERVVLDQKALGSQRSRTESPDSRQELKASGKPIAFDEEGGLLIVEAKTEQLQLISRDNTVLPRAWPGQDDSAKARAAELSCGFNNDAAGLCIENATGKAWQTLNAAESWTRTEGPGRPVAKTRIYCGATRCSDENSFVREGWDEPGAWPTEEVPTSPKTQTETPSELSFTCKTDAANTPKLPARFSTAEFARTQSATTQFALYRGFGEAVWAGTALLEEPPTAKQLEQHQGPHPTQRRLYVLRGREDGSVTHSQVRSWRGVEPVNIAHIYSSNLGLLLWGTNEMYGMSGSVHDVSGVLLKDPPGSVPRPVRAPFDSVGFNCFHSEWPVATTETMAGIAIRQLNGRKVIWLTEAGRSEARDWPGSLQLARESVMLELADERWLVAQLVDGGLELTEVEESGEGKHVRSAVRTGRETGVGLRQAESGIEVALIDVDEDGKLVLWRYPVDDGLRLGAAVQVDVGNRSTWQLTLPSCSATVPAGIMAARRGDIPVVMNGEPGRGHLFQRIRFDAAEACVERSVLDVDGPSDYDPKTRIVSRGAMDTPLVGAVEGQLPVGVSCSVAESNMPIPTN